METRFTAIKNEFTLGYVFSFKRLLKDIFWAIFIAPFRVKNRHEEAGIIYD